MFLTKYMMKKEEVDKTDLNRVTVIVCMSKPFRNSSWVLGMGIKRELFKHHPE
jgi:hypothetical protein